LTCLLPQQPFHPVVQQIDPEQGRHQTCGSEQAKHRHQRAHPRRGRVD
jgi:hypothetical protein